MARPEEVSSAALHERPASLDLDHLVRATLASAALEREVLGLFLRQAGSLVARLTSAESAEQWRADTHMLKGSASGIGAFPLAQIVADGEKASNESSRAKAVAAIEAELAAVRIAIEARLATL